MRVRGRAGARFAIPRIRRVLRPPREVLRDFSGEIGGIAHGGGDGDADDVRAQEEEERVQAGAYARTRTD